MSDPKTHSFSLSQDGKLVLNLDNSAIGGDNIENSKKLIQALAAAGIRVRVDSQDGNAIGQTRGITPGASIFSGEGRGSAVPQAQFIVDSQVNCQDPKVLAKIAKVLDAPGVLTEQGQNWTVSEQKRTVVSSITPQELQEAQGDLAKLEKATTNLVRKEELGYDFIQNAKNRATQAAADLVKPQTSVQHSTDGAGVSGPAPTVANTLSPELQKLVKHIDALLNVPGMKPEGLKAFAEAGNAEMAQSAAHSVEVLQQIKKSINNPAEVNRLVSELASDPKAIKSIQKAVDSSKDANGQPIDLSGDYVRLKTSLKQVYEEPLPEVQAKPQGRPR